MTSVGGVAASPQRKKPPQIAAGLRSVLGIFNNLSIQIGIDRIGAAVDLPVGSGSECLFDLDAISRGTASPYQRAHSEAAGIQPGERGCCRYAHENISLRFLGEQWREPHFARSAVRGNQRRP